MKTQNQNRPGYRRINDDFQRRESSLRENRYHDPSDERRPYDERRRDAGRVYNEREEYYSGQRSWQENEPPSFYGRPFRDERNAPWPEDREYYNRNKYRDNEYREEDDPGFDRDSRRPAEDRDERHAGHYRGTRESYKGRYYGKRQSEQDLREIRGRYEESRRNSEWSNAYLPTNNF